MSSLKALLKTPYPYIYLLSFAAVLVLWNFIKIPPETPPPAGIVGRVTVIGYNPENNVIRFMLAVLVPPMACFGYWLFSKYSTKVRWLQSKAAHGLALAGVITLTILLTILAGTMQGSTNPANNPTDQYGPHEYYLVDTFHEGETLGPAVSYEQKDAKPYTDYVVRHGIFTDAIRSVAAWKLFGRSIGAERTFTTILIIVTCFAYLALLLVLFKGNWLKSALGMVALAVLMMPPGIIPFFNEFFIGAQLRFRDITTILFLIAAILAVRYAAADRLRAMAASIAGAGFVISAGYANSVDTAFYVTVLGAFLGVLLLIVVGLKPWLKFAVLPGVIGLAIGSIVLAIALKGDFIGIFEYMSTTLKYNNYLDGDIYPRPDSAVSVLLISLGGVVAAGFYWLVQFIQSRKKSNAKGTSMQLVAHARKAIVAYHPAILLGVTAVLCMRSAIGRADISHYVYSVQWIYLLMAFLFINWIFSHRKHLRSIALASMLALLFVAVCYAGIVKSQDAIKHAYPVNVPDTKLVRKDYLDAADYLKNNLKGDETYVTLTSEAIWYYLTDTPSPVKYPILWYANTSELRTSLADSIENNKDIKYIVTNTHWTNNIDYVPNEVRFPEVYDVLNNEFKPHKGIGQQTIWIRK